MATTKMCQFCANWGTMNCPNSSKCFTHSDKPYWKPKSSNVKLKIMKRLINRFICLIRGHKMTEGLFERYDNFNKKYYIYYEKYCSRCGKVKYRDRFKEL